ncbi:MAG: transporter substrate-binding domain-containing protein [Alphaproteobacteria bacterium]|nr:transporter substrate-binding domain-containing protein [Alphaproteobacteria bacterium]
MKHLVGLFLLGLMLAAHPASAADVIVYTENYGDFNAVDDQGHVVGGAADLVRQVMDESGLEYEIKLVPWNRAYQLATKMDNAFIYAMLRTPQREDHFHWLTPVFETDLYLYGRADETRPIDIATLKTGRLTGACMIGDASCGILLGLGLPKKNLFEVADSHRGEMKVVASGRADVFVAQELHQLEDGRLILDPNFRKLFKLDEAQRFYLAAGKQVTPRFVESVRQAYESLKKSGSLVDVHHQHDVH